MSDVHHDRTDPDSAASPVANGIHPEGETPGTGPGPSAALTNGVDDDATGQPTPTAAQTPIMSKKRKLDDISGRSRSASRAASPPWKSFSAEGPTQFTDNGKRRSGRVNQLPSELQHRSPKRTKRSHRENPNGKRLKADEPGDAIPSDVSAPRIRKKPGRKPRHRSDSTKCESPKSKEVPPPTRVSSRTKVSPKHFDEIVVQKEEVDDTPPPVKRRPGRPPKKRSGTPPTSPTVRRVKRESHTHENDSRIGRTSAKLRFRLPRGAVHPPHPAFLVRPPQFGSLIEVLETYDQKEREAGAGDRDDRDGSDVRPPTARTSQTLEEQASHEAHARLRILDAARDGGPLCQEACSLFFPDHQEEPPVQYSHADHLWSQGAYFRTLLRREKTHHMDLARKTAHACLAKWKEKQPQTDEDRVKQEDEWFRLIYKQTAKDLARKWDLVSAEVERMRLKRLMEEQELTRDRKMQRLLEDTTAMLERRRVGFENDDDDDDEDDGDDGDDSNASASDGDGNGSDSDTMESDDAEEDDEVMSTSESEDDEDPAEGDMDEDLSPEALRAKYAHIPDIPQDDSSDEEASQSPSQVADMSHVQLDDVDDALMDDEDDDSTDMSDDMGSSDDGTASEDDITDEDASDEDVGLMGFLGGRERREIETPVVGDVDQNSENKLANRDAGIHDPENTEPIASEAEAEPLSLDAPREPSQAPSLQPGTSAEGDHSSQPTPMDSSTAAHTEAESTTTIDPEDVARMMPRGEDAHPSKGITTKIPTLLRATLREYQHYGLDWLAKLYMNQTNGILADEMGLGKTIQTIALLAHLAEEHEVWGPHLIVVPTSVILNWEMEFKKFLPGFKVLSYYGSAEERQQKRKGWANPDNYNVVITSYQLVLKDLLSIRVPEWHYMILDEAHNIKNFQSQRYQAMIRLKTHARLLLTGTPLQNSIQELWSLLTFLTAGQDGQGMGDLDEFTQWFKRPVDEIFVDGKNKLGVEAQEIVHKLHHSLRPYILRRMKSQVEKQLPGKYEHTVFCRLSKRQRQLYDQFLSRADVKEKLSSGNPISVSQALMALRKVCNHPDLFEERPVVTSFTVRKPYSRVPRSVVADYEIKELLIRKRLLQQDPERDLDSFMTDGFDLQRLEKYGKYHSDRTKRLSAAPAIRNWRQHFTMHMPIEKPVDGTELQNPFSWADRHALTGRIERLSSYIETTHRRADRSPVYGCDLVARCTIRTSDRLPLPKPDRRSQNGSPLLAFADMSVLSDIVRGYDRRGSDLTTEIQKFGFVTPNAVAQDVLDHSLSPSAKMNLQAWGQSDDADPFHEARVRLSIAFPDKRLLQYDCGKLQRLAILLRELHDKGSRALIFTQMTSVLDILERFLNIHGYKYMRLDGSTRIEQRQDMMERFNRDERIDVFILSSRSGGIGMNLTGADSVIFYDLDWNPQMDKQCQDRAHRIGQTRDVHIYKMVSEHTIEVNILRKSNQKRMLDEVVIQEGDFTTDFFNKNSSSNSNSNNPNNPNKAEDPSEQQYEADDFAGAAVDRVLGLSQRDDVGKVLAAAEEVIDIEAAKAQQKEAYVDDADFDLDKPGARRKSSTSGVTNPGGGGGGGGAAAAGSTAAGRGLLGDEEEEGPEDDDNHDGDEKAHVDEYMLRFMQRVQEGAPFMPPVERVRPSRLDNKHGKEKRARPRRGGLI